MTESLMHSVFKAYDVRGDFPSPLSLDLCASIARRLPIRSVVIGLDTRPSSIEIFQTLVQSFLSQGVHVIDVGRVSSPLACIASFEYKTDASVMITASHNPLPQNGLKITLFGVPLTGEEIKNLKEFLPSQSLGIKEAKDIRDIYIQSLLAIVKGQSFKIVWDAGHGVMGPILQSLIPLLPYQSHLIRCIPDSSKDFADPSKDLNVLSNVVLESKSDIGFAFDSDGDRLGIVDRNGKMISIDRIFPLLVSNLSPCKVLLDQKCSNQTFDRIKQLGCAPKWTKTGHALVKKALREEKARFAGERSGHIFFSDWYDGIDDPLYAALKFLSQWDGTFLDQEPHGCNLLLPAHNRRLMLEKIRFKLLNDKRDFLNIDGLRVSHPLGWWLIRSSNTEPILNGRYEAYNREDLECIKQDLQTYLND